MRWPWLRPAPTTLGPVLVCPADQAADVARASSARLIVSISDPELRARTDALLRPYRGTVCRLDFHDIERPSPGLIMGQALHVRQALETGTKLRAHQPIVVHCHAGISRSGAFGLLLAAARLRAAGLDPETCAAHATQMVRAHAPHVRPNMGLLSLGAEHTGADAPALIAAGWACHGA